MMHQLKKARFVTLSFDTIELLAPVLAKDPDLVELRASPFPNLKFLDIKRYHHQMGEALPWTVVKYLTKESSYGESLMVKYFPEGINEEEGFNYPIRKAEDFSNGGSPVDIVNDGEMVAQEEMVAVAVEEDRIWDRMGKYCGAFGYAVIVGAISMIGLLNYHSQFFTLADTCKLVLITLLCFLLFDLL